MVTGYEVGMYGNIDEMARHLDRIATALEKIAEQGERNPYFHQEDVPADQPPVNEEKGIHDERPAHRD